MSAISRRAVREPLLSFRCERRNFSIGRINDQRGSPGLHNFGSAIPPKIVVGAAHIGFCRTVAAVGVLSRQDLLGVFKRFRFGEKLFSRKLSGTLQWCNRGVAPN